MKKIRIGVDGNEANVPNKVGVSVYTSQLLHYFQSLSSDEVRFVVYLRSAPLADMPKPNSYFSYEIVWGPLLWSQFFLPLRLWLLKLSGTALSVFFSPAHYIPRFCPFKTVVTIHDLSYLYFPEEFLKKDLYQLKNWTGYALKNAAKVIAVSKTTKKDIIHEYAVPEDKIEVIYNGYTKPDHTVTIKKRMTNDFPYFLYVGTIQPRKNLELLINAFAQYHLSHPSFKLIIAGKKGWLYQNIFDLVETLALTKDVLFPGFVTEEEKNELYRGASACILPSLYEGFGLPLLEAMGNGCPVISSYSSSLPEIGGEACLYFDPKNRDDLVDKMNTVIMNSELVKDLIRKGRVRINSFSWLETGRRTLHSLQSVTE